jgi:hypothetical protein
MTSIWTLASLWLGLALIASLISIWLRISTALSEIVVGTIAQLIIGALIGSTVLGTDESWIRFLSGLGAIVLTFLAGAELDPAVFRLKWREAAAVGLASFFFPFLGCAAAAHFILGWELMLSWLAGVAMSTTSVAVVYAVMLEFGFNRTEYGKTVLAACFVTDLGTVIALGLIFAPFTLKTVVFLVVGIVVFLLLPWLTPRFFRLYGNRPSELETKFLLLCLLGMGSVGRLGGQRGGVAGLPDRNGAGRNSGKGSCTDPAAANPHLRAVDAVLLHSRGFVRLDTFTRSGACGIPVLPGRQDRHQDRGRLSGHKVVRSAGPRGEIHDTADVDRVDVRHDIVAVWPVAWHHRSSPILVPRCGRDRQRGHSNVDRQCALPAQALVAAVGTGRSGGTARGVRRL